MKSWAIGALLLAFPGASRESPLAGLPAAAARVREAAGAALPLVRPEIRVFKAAHRLELWASGRKLRTYAAGLGHRGLADKRRSGAHLTPEGRYYVCTRNSTGAYHLFLGISYPSELSADRGYREGLISRRQRDAIIAANRRGACPDWSTPLGGTVGIHGHGSGSDWTWGCVALEDADVDELWAACPLGTLVLIEP